MEITESMSLLVVLLSCSRVSEQLYAWCTRQPSQAMHMRTATVLPLKPQPVVLGTKDVQVKAFEGLLESLVEKPVWVVNDCMHSHPLDYHDRSNLLVLATEGQQHCG